MHRPAPSHSVSLQTGLALVMSLSLSTTLPAQRLPEPDEGQAAPPLEPFPAQIVRPRSRVSPRPELALPAVPQPLPPRPHVTLKIPATEANLQVIVPESIVNRILAGNRTQSEPVRDNILGADVLGQQTTVTAIGIDFHPRESGILATMRLLGRTTSDTIGLTLRAQVSTVGQHRLWAAKEILYDGKKFTTRPAQVRVNVSTRTVDASTRYDNVPLLRGIARQIAVNTANGRRLLSDPIVGQRISAAAFQKFNGEVDRQLSQANQSLERSLRPQLRKWSVAPARETVLSTESHVVYSALLRQAESLAGAVPPATAANDSVMTLRIHESLLNQASEALRLEGQSRRPEDMTEIVMSIVALLGGKPADSREEAATQRPKAVGARTRILDSTTDPNLFEPTMVFAQSQPLEFRFEEALFAIIMTVRFDVSGRTVVPEQRVRIEFRAELDGDQFRLRRESVQVVAVDETPAETQRLYTELVRPRVEASIPDLVFPRSRQLPEPLLRALRVERMESSRGWLTAELALK